MNWKKAAAAAVFVLALGGSIGADAATISLPGLSGNPAEQSGAFRTDDYHLTRAYLKSPYLIAHGINENFAGYVNAAIAREKRNFLDELSREPAGITGIMTWNEGLIANYYSNMQGITSLVLIEEWKSASGSSLFVKGLNFDAGGNLIPFKRLFPRMTAGDAEERIQAYASKAGIMLLPHRKAALPTNYYVSKKGVVYAIYQPGERTLYKYGVFCVPIGTV